MENIENVQKSKIVNVGMYFEALKNSGYRGTDNAVAEIVDNSIDAHAENVFIIGTQSINDNKEKGIVSFAFLDDGDGMDFKTLNGCLALGFTTNSTRRGIGRFGVGLPQASIFVCNKVEVYSWQNGIENCQSVHLDYDEIKQNDLYEMDLPVTKAIPEEYKKFIRWNSNNKKYDFSEHGTLVIWTKCTHVDYKKWNTCVNHMREDLGRKYRHYISEGHANIKMIELTSLSTVDILPNDPLYLTVPSLECVPSDLAKFKADGYVSQEYNKDTGYDECLFEPYGEEPEKLEIVFEENGEKKTGFVTIKYSVVKHKYYSARELKTETKPGALPYGRKGSVLDKNKGISIVRNGREIQFGSFGFYDIYNKPEYKWWGIEIAFNSDLDTAFGVANNKQSVVLNPLTKEEMQEFKKDEIKTVWHQLADSIIPTIREMDNRNSKIRGEDVDVEDPNPTTSSEISNKVDDEEAPSENTTPTEEQEKEAKEQLENEGVENPTDSQVKKLIDSKVRVVTVYNKGKNDQFVDYSFAAGTLSIILNAKHTFYENLVRKIMENENDKVSFELFLMAIVKSIRGLDSLYPDAMDNLMRDINKRISDYMWEYMKTHE